MIEQQIKMCDLITQIKKVLPDIEFSLREFFGDIIQIRLINRLYITGKEYHKLNQIITITNVSYDKDMDRLVVSGYMVNGYI
jgi:hypothetical protein